MRTISAEAAVAHPRASTLAEVEHRLAELLDLQAQLYPSPASAPTAHSTTKPEPPPPPPYKQELGKDALYGLAGRIVKVLAPHSEAHPAAILLQLLAAFGNAVGRGPHCMVESTRHGLNLFVVLVGDSSKGRKGTSWNLIANLFAEVDPSWLSSRVNSARLTAIGLVQALRDQQPLTDRRLLVLSEEFANILRTFKGGSGHLGPLLRGAWDSGHLPTLDMRQHLRATDTHVSLIAHISRDELAHSLHRTEAHNGFANRCLWTWVERANCLPNPGSPPAHELAAAVAGLRSAVSWATERPEILFRRDEVADQLWAYCYPHLSNHRPGLRGAATSRGEAQVLRLSALFAALDRSEIIQVPHLQAAFDVWTYCYESAGRLFGLSTGNPIADRIREAIEASQDGLSRKQITAIFHCHVDSDRIEEALHQLASLGAIQGHTLRTAGRPTTLWTLAEEQPTDEINQPAHQEEEA
jgi:hypothetical protein